MQLKLAALDDLLAKMDQLEFLSTNAPAVPTVIDHLLFQSPHNPSVALKQSFEELRSIALTIEYFDLAMIDFQERCTPTGLMGPFCAILHFQNSLFVRIVEIFREYLILALYRIFVKNREIIPNKIAGKWGGKAIQEYRDADFYDLVDRYFSGGLAQICKQIEKDFGFNPVSGRFHFLRLNRYLEMRNCFVHHAKYRSTKFMEMAGAKNDRRLENITLHVPSCRIVLLFITKAVISADEAIASKLPSDRSYITWPLYPF